MLKGLLSFFDVKNTVITEEDKILLEEVKKDIPLFDKDTGMEMVSSTIFFLR